VTTIHYPIPEAPNEALVFELDETSWVQKSMAEQLQSPAGYEPATWAAMRAILRPGDVAIDVGAHVGVMTCYMASLVGLEGRVETFEPVKANRDKLMRHLFHNDLLLRVHVHGTAVGRTASKVPFHLNADNDGGGALWDVRTHPFNKKSREAGDVCIAVPLDALDDVVHTPPVRLIKIDTEGAELEVLNGAVRILERDQPYIIAEINPHGLGQLGATEKQLREFLTDRGYRVFLLWDKAPYLREIPLNGYLSAEFVFNCLFVPAGAEVPCV